MVQHSRPSLNISSKGDGPWKSRRKKVPSTRANQSSSPLKHKTPKKSEAKKSTQTNVGNGLSVLADDESNSNNIPSVDLTLDQLVRTISKPTADVQDLSEVRPLSWHSLAAMTARECEMLKLPSVTTPGSYRLSWSDSPPEPYDIYMFESIPLLHEAQALFGPRQEHHKSICVEFSQLPRPAPILLDPRVANYWIDAHRAIEKIGERKQARSWLANSLSYNDPVRIPLFLL
jgi:hypothetical protein